MYRRPLTCSTYPTAKGSAFFAGGPPCALHHMRLSAALSRIFFSFGAQASAAAAGAGVPSARPATSGGAGLVGRVTDLGRQVLHTFLHPGQQARSDAGAGHTCCTTHDTHTYMQYAVAG